jgi:hypothetical protein
MCFSSTAAMAIKYLNPTALLGSNADDDYLKRVLRYGDTTEATAHLRAAFDYGIKATFLTNGTRTTLEKELDAGYPVACGILHHGPAHAPRGGGHWMLVVGLTDTHVICHDPKHELKQMAFPVSPTEGQTFTENNTVWIYSAVMGQWNRSVINPLNETGAWKWRK